MDKKELIAMILANEKLTADEKLKMITALQAEEKKPDESQKPAGSKPESSQKPAADLFGQLPDSERGGVPAAKPGLDPLAEAEKIIAEKKAKEEADKKLLEENVEAKIYLDSGYLADLDLLSEDAKAKFHLTMESDKSEGIEKAKLIKKYITKLYTDNLPAIKTPITSSLKARIEQAKLNPENGYGAIKEYAELFKIQSQQEVKTQANSLLATDAQYAQLTDAEKREHDQSRAHLIRAQKLLDKVKKEE